MMQPQFLNLTAALLGLLVATSSISAFTVDDRLSIPLYSKPNLESTVDLFSLFLRIGKKVMPRQEV